jgi:AcrR family transcriptional regulator
MCKHPEVEKAMSQKYPSASRRGRPSSEESERILCAVLDAAQNLFMKQGFASTTMEAVAQTAGLTKRTVYRKMPNKTALFEAVVRRYAEAHKLPAFSRVQNGSLEERLSVAAVHLLDWILEPEVLTMYRVTVAEAAQFPMLARVVADVAVKGATEAIAGILAADSPHRSCSSIHFGAEMFMAIVAALPFHQAVELRDSPGMTLDKQKRAYKCVKFFLKAWNS